VEESLEQTAGDYYLDVKEFKTGGVEVLLKAIRPMHEGAVRSVADPDSYANACKALGESSSVYSGPKFVHDEEEISDFKRTENHLRAVRRATQKIRWYTCNFAADRLLTLTYRDNVIDREDVKADFKRFLRLVKSGWGGQEGFKDWRYVAVVEQQERGAYHIHCAVKGWQKISFLRAAWYKALGGKSTDEGAETRGNINVTSPKKARWGTEFREWKTGKLVAYLVKYLAKTFDESAVEKKRFWHSRDLQLPVSSRFMLSATDLVSAIKESLGVLYFQFGQEIDFSRSWLSSSKDCLWLSLGVP